MAGLKATLQCQSGGQSFLFSLFFLKVYLNSKMTTAKYFGQGVTFLSKYFDFNKQNN